MGSGLVYLKLEACRISYLFNSISLTSVNFPPFQFHSLLDKHKAIGLTVLVLGSLQVIALLARPGKESKVRKYWNWYHHGLGRALILLAAVNVFYGIHLGNGGNKWNTGYAFALVVLVIVAVILELRVRMRKYYFFHVTQSICPID